MLDIHINFTPLKLELLRFSKYKVCAGEKEKNSCSDAIKKIKVLQKNRAKAGFRVAI